MLCVWQGGLWRLTGQQIAGAAAEVEAGATPASGKGGTEGASEDVRGPHAALAVKLQVTGSSECPPTLHMYPCSVPSCKWSGAESHVFLGPKTKDNDLSMMC